MKRKIEKLVSGRMRTILSFMSVLAACFLLSSAQLRTWGPNKSVITMGGSFAFVGIVAGFKKKGIELEGEELKQFQAFDEILENNLKGLITADEFKKQFEELKATLSEESMKKLAKSATDEIEETLKKQAAAIDQLKTMGIPVGPNGGAKSLRNQIKEQLLKEDAQAILKAMKNADVSSQNMSIKMNIKAAGTMETATTTAYTTAGTSIAMPAPEFIPGLNNVARNKPFLLQLLKVTPTSKENIVYTEKTNVQGAPAWVGEGVSAGQVSFDIKIGNSRAKMASAYIKVSTQMLDDVDYIAAEIENELVYQLAITIDTGLLQGDGTGDNLAGIASVAPAYVLTTVATTTPNTIDAIIAAATQIKHDNFIADIACVNPIDWANTKLLKGTTGYYVINPNQNGNNLGPIVVVESNQVPVGKVLVMDSSKVNVRPYQDFMLSYGFVNDDFVKNLVTIKANQRLHEYVKSNDVNALVYDDIANIITAITKV